MADNTKIKSRLSGDPGASSRENENVFPLIELQAPRAWQTVLIGSESVAGALSRYIAGQRWFSGKSKTVRGAEIREIIPLSMGDDHSSIAFVEVQYADGVPDIYLVPIASASGHDAERIEAEWPRALIARTRCENLSGVLFDPAVTRSDFVRTILNALSKRRSFKGRNGEVQAVRYRAFKSLYEQLNERFDVRPGTAEQSNSSALIGDQLIFKLYRRLEAGRNPEVELGRFLNQKGFRNTPKIAGHLQYVSAEGENRTLALVQEYVSNESNAWELALERVQRCVARVIFTRETQAQPVQPGLEWLENRKLALPEEIDKILGPDKEVARLLGRRTAEMHLKLASDRESSEFRPEPYTSVDRRELVRSISELLAQVCGLLAKRAVEISGQARKEAERLVQLETKINAWLKKALDQELVSHRIRVHGDFHLGQVLYTGNDFVIIDFEGEPARPMRQRRAKKSALVDVAGMVRSFHYAALSGWNASAEKRLFSQAEMSRLESWIDAWQAWMSSVYLHAYYQGVRKQPVIAGDSAGEVRTLLDLFLLEKAIYEVGYELNNRPHWVGIPLAGIGRVLQDLKLLERRTV
ncbi:MAG: putative maltokinase [Deltaproteobacteria bacterium]|nr:putative maltokinase [Deltaproteobacteria bacterium]